MIDTKTVTSDAKKGVFNSASGFEASKHPNGRPCNIIRKCEDGSDPYLIQNDLQEEAPCYLIEVGGVTMFALLEEITILH